MNYCSHKQPKVSERLIDFLKLRIGLSDSSLELGLRQSDSEQAPLPIVLWSFGLITKEQFIQVLEWNDSHL